MSEPVAQLSPLLFSAPLRVLLVEGDAQFAWALQRFLEAQGCRVEVQADGVGALGRLMREPLPELVLLDARLPGVHGRDLAAEVERTALGPGVPVLRIAGAPDGDGAPLPPHVVGRVERPSGPGGAGEFFRAVGEALGRVRAARAKCPWGGG